MYCFSGVGGGGGVNVCQFFAGLGHFSETIRARALKLGSYIYLDEVSSKLPSILSLDLLTVH